ncbi:MAG TPA: ATP-binding cassette domain-containing protein, partial [Chloroflexota bacterium]|nr:ATP-binding cassette domain-containing protein [Chloroflexota bacterium]
VGYIGPNGAGKSTTIKMLTGILVPTSGQVTVVGIAPWENRERNAMNIGVVFGQRTQLWWDLPLIESFDLVAKLYRIEPSRYRRNLDRFREVLGLDDFIATPVRLLSLGQRMRSDLAAAMLYEPRILYLDEPTVGLDVLAKERMRVFIEEMNRETGTTIILTTHDLADIERLCRRIILIDHGRVLFDGAVDALKSRYAPHRILVATLAPESAAEFESATLNLPGLELVRRDEGKLWFHFDPRALTAAAVIVEVTSKVPITDVSVGEPELEQVIRQIYEERPPA